MTKLVQQQAYTGFMWEKSLENVRFGDRRNEKNRDEITIRIPGALAEMQTEEETIQAMYI